MPISSLGGSIIKSLGSNGLMDHYENETWSFQNRIITNGGNKLSTIELNAIDWKIKSEKREGIWGLKIAEYPFVGGNGSTGSLASFAVNLVSSLYTLTPVSVTNAMCTANGFLATGTGIYWNTGINHSSIINLNSNGLSFYSRTNNIGGVAGVIDMGAIDTTGPYSSFSLFSQYASANRNDFFDSTSISTGRITDTIQTSSGYKSGNRISSSISALFDRGVKQSSIATNGGVGINYNIFLGAANQNGSVTFSGSLRQYTHFCINNGYTDAQELKRYQIQQAFEGMLNRAV